jgi:hypothetical protein
MRMSDRLACRLANIDAYVVAVRRAVRFDVTPNCRKKSPDGSLFFGGEGEEISFVSPRNNQAVSIV